MNKKKVMRIVLVSVGAIIAIAIVAVLIIFANLNSIARKGIVEVMSYVLKVDVTLKKADIKPFSGKAFLEGLVIGNPEGYKTKEAFSVERIEVALNIKSFRTDEPTVSLISLNNPRITLEQGFPGSNLTKLIENAERLQSKEEKAPPKASEKKIKVDKIIVEGAMVSVSAPVLAGKSLTIPLPRIEMNDFGGKKKSMTIAESIKEFFSQIIRSIASAGSGILPDDILKTLNSSIKGAANAVSKGAGSAAEQIGKGGKAVMEGVGDAAKDIKGIFKKDKKN